MDAEIIGKISFLGLGFLSFIVCIYKLYEESNIKTNWLRTEATITDMELSKGCDETDIIVKYKYSVNGKEFTGNRISPYHNITYGINTKEPERLSIEYPEGTKVQIYYKPSSIETSYLTANLCKKSYLKTAALVGALFTIAGLFI